MINLNKLSKLLFRPNPVNGYFNNLLNPNYNVLMNSSLLIDKQACFFGKPKQGEKKESRRSKENAKSFVLSDEKSAKLSKAEEEAEQKKKKADAEKARLAKLKAPTVHMKTQLANFENTMSRKKVLQLMDKKRLAEMVKINEAMGELREIKRQKRRKAQAEALGEQVIEKTEEEAPKELEEKVIRRTKVEGVKTLNNMPRREPPTYRRKIAHDYHNCENTVNASFNKDLKQVTPTSQSWRTGVLGIKMGMTALWDKWGTRHALTVIQLDRCQVVQVKTKEKEGYNALQMGVGEKNFKRLKKPEIGHYMKAAVPAKQKLVEFKVTPDCLLPVGYMMSARHFTPGQYVDVTGITIGKGMTGTIKKWHFHRQPATHGCSLSHRVLGSTGMRQDPGHVFKGKKMPGRLGGKRRTIQNQRIYKIDVPRALLYIKGQTPGKPGTVIHIKDAIKKIEKNEDWLNYPTFIPQKGTKYALEMILEAPEQDPEEVYTHDNDVVDPPGEGEDISPLPEVQDDVDLE